MLVKIIYLKQSLKEVANVIASLKWLEIFKW